MVRYIKLVTNTQECTAGDPSESEAIAVFKAVDDLSGEMSAIFTDASTIPASFLVLLKQVEQARHNSPHDQVMTTYLREHLDVLLQKLHSEMIIDCLKQLKSKFPEAELNVIITKLIDEHT